MHKYNIFSSKKYGVKTVQAESIREACEIFGYTLKRKYTVNVYSGSYAAIIVDNNAPVVDYIVLKSQTGGANV